MMVIILAGAFGALALFVFLLFRHLRNLSWQITQLRVERDSERILHDIGIRTQPKNNKPDQMAGPVRRKGHLALYLGGGLAAALAQLRDLTRQQRQALVASGAAATAALAAFSLLLIAASAGLPPEGESPGIPSGEGSSPSTQPGTLSPAPTVPSPAPSATTGSGSGDDQDYSSGRVIPLTRTSPGRTPGEPTPTTGRRPPPGATPGGTSSPPTQTGSPAPSIQPSATLPATAPPSYALCVDARALRELRVCLGA